MHTIITTFTRTLLLTLTFFITVAIGQVTTTSPIANTLNVNTTTTISATFSVAMNQATMTNSTVRVNGSLSGLHSGSISYNSSQKKMTFNPDVDFEYNEVVAVILTNGILNGSNVPITPYIFQFTTGVQPSTGFFTQKALPTAGSSPYGIAAGDWNGDGYLDLAATNFEANDVSVCYFMNDTTYNPITTFEVGDAPKDIIAGDWDRDGDIDLATANFSSNNISVLMNDGNGVFTSSNDTSNGVGTASLVAVDIEGDGDFDFAAINSTTQSLVMLINDGNANFTANTPISMATAPVSITSGDVNGNDGDMDIVVTTSSSVDIYINDGGGNFSYSTLLTTGAVLTHTSIGDINGNGELDLVIINYDSNFVSLFPNDGNGNFTVETKVTVATGGVSSAFIDKDNDGDLDLAVVHATQNYATILQNDGAGNYTHSSLASAKSSPRDIVVLDFERTGGVDIAITNSGNNSISVLKNVNTASNTGSISGLVFNDLNGNGVRDNNDVTGITNWRIYLTGNVNDSTFTDNLGKFNFGSLPSGTYYLRQVVQEGWYRTLPANTDTITISLSSAQNDTGRNFGNFKYGVIRGTKFSDADGDGVKDTLETGLANWSIALSGTATQSTLTNAEGNYEFYTLLAGDYTVSEVRQGGWTRTLPADPGIYSLNVQSADTLSGKDFGNFGGKTKFRTFKADTSLINKSVKLKYKSGLLVGTPNMATAVEGVFKKMGKVMSPVLGFAQTNKDSAKKYAWVLFKTGKDLGKLYTTPHDSAAYPLDSLRIPLKKTKKLSKAIKPARKTYNNIGIEQGIVFNLSLIASRDSIAVTEPKFGSLILDTAIVFAGRQMQGQSLSAVGRYFDSAMTYWQIVAINNQTAYQNLRELVGVLKEINNRFSVTLATNNYTVDSLGIVAKKNPYALKLKGEKYASQVGIIRELPNAKSGEFQYEYANAIAFPEQFTLHQNYPNPFNPTTTIKVSVNEPAFVGLKIYNILGQEVATLLNNEFVDEGTHEIEFDASSISSGVYFYRLNVEQNGTTNFSETKKMMLIK
ncbi:MAG: FG-GAP-like repeat-containing protein [Bacteroidota bacterium]